MLLHTRMRVAAFATVGTFLIAHVAAAVSPSVSTILPRGGQRGGEVEVTFKGQRLEDAIDLIFHEPGISLGKIIRTDQANVVCTLTIAPDCAIGTHAIRMRTRTGISNFTLFSVGNLTELEEAEPNSISDQAQVIEMNSTVNGIVTSEDIDYFAVDLTKGDRLSVEIEALRLGGKLFDPKLRLFSPSGHELLAEDDTPLFLQDAAFVHTAANTGRYRIAVSEASYGGATNYYYRLHVGNFPRPMGVSPMGGKPGAESTFHWLGDRDNMTQTVSMPEHENGLLLLSPVTDLGVAPTPVPVRVSALDGTFETEPNNSPETATEGTAPGSFDGVIGEPGDSDWFRFDAKSGEKYDLRVWARELGSPLDSVMTVFAPSGKQIASSDDSVGMDSYARVSFPEDGTYTVAVRDHLWRGGPVFAYRLEATRVEPSLSFIALEARDGSVTVPRGNRAALLLSLTRKEFNDAVVVDFDGLPEGVSAEAAVFAPGANRLIVLLHATREAPSSGKLVSVRGTSGAISGGIKHPIALVKGRNDTVFLTRTLHALAVGVGDPAPFSVEVVQPAVPLVRRGHTMLRIRAQRSEGFTDPIELYVPFVPGAFGTGTAKIAGDQTEVTLRVEAKANAPLGELSFVIIAKSAGYEVSTSFVRLDIADPWVRFEIDEFQADQGKTVDLVVRVKQAHAFEGTHQVELVALPKGVTTSPQEFTAETTELIFPIAVAADAATGKHQSLRFQTAIPHSGESIAHVSPGAAFTIFKPLPPKLKPKPAPEPKVAAAEVPKPKRRTRFPETN